MNSYVYHKSQKKTVKQILHISNRQINSRFMQQISTFKGLQIRDPIQLNSLTHTHKIYSQLDNYIKTSQQLLQLICNYVKTTTQTNTRYETLRKVQKHKISKRGFLDHYNLLYQRDESCPKIIIILYYRKQQLYYIIVGNNSQISFCIWFNQDGSHLHINFLSSYQKIITKNLLQSTNYNRDESLRQQLYYFIVDNNYIILQQVIIRKSRSASGLIKIVCTYTLIFYHRIQNNDQESTIIYQLQT
eukprot:TRINITY_DN17000_c0_g1_i23.p1 TRINITY_DN17000_c0_g1~~TRINITY_DN17000_c0_g1_i23.p1  ORF type:complete len:245 (-),score=-28.50 TRINITY_DN17000_c0_g1_i23:1714-2448(-)